MKKMAFVALAGLLLGSGPHAYAEQGPAGGRGGGRGGALRAACGADIQKLCPNATDRKARRQCLTDNKAQLSKACADALATVRSGSQPN